TRSGRLLYRDRRGDTRAGSIDLRRRSGDRARPRTQAKLMHDAAYMVGIVTDAVAHLHGCGEARSGPASVTETGSAGAIAIDLSAALLLFLIEATGPAGSSPFVQRLHSLG